MGNVDLTDPKGAVLLQSTGFAAPRDAAQAMARLQAEGEAAIVALQAHLVQPVDTAGAAQALRALQQAAG